MIAEVIILRVVYSIISEMPIYLLIYFYPSTVEFFNKEDAEKAIKELDCTEYSGRTMFVREASVLTCEGGGGIQGGP